MTNFSFKRISKLTNNKVISEFKTFPNQAIIGWLQDGSNKTQIIEISQGKAIMLMEDNCDDPFVFIAGLLDVAVIDIVKKICPPSYPMVYCNPKFHNLFIDRGWDFNLRVQFRYNKSSNVELQNTRKIKAIDHMDIFKQCYWFDKISRQYNNSEDFLSSNRGYVIYENEKVISEAYIEYEGNGYAEIAAVTNPSYRGQGAATQISSYIANKCVKLGLIPIWSCQIQNKGSIKTALKAGFFIEKYYMTMVPNVGNTYGPRLEEWIKNKAK